MDRDGGGVHTWLPECLVMSLVVAWCTNKTSIKSKMAPLISKNAACLYADMFTQGNN